MLYRLQRFYSHADSEVLLAIAAEHASHLGQAMVSERGSSGGGIQLSPTNCIQTKRI